MKSVKTLPSMQDVLDALPCAIYWKDTNGIYLGCNKKQAIHWGEKSPDKIIGKTDENLYFKHRLKSIKEDDRKVIQDKAPILKEDTTRLPNGEEQCLLIHKLPLVDSNGKICGIVGMAHDVTKEKQYLRERALQAQAHELYSVYIGLSTLQLSIESLIRTEKLK